MTSRYRPRLSWRPIVPVRWRNMPHGYPGARKAWSLYLFGLVPIARIPRKSSAERAS